MTISLRGVSVLLFIATAARGPRTAAAAGDPLLQPPDTSSWAGPRYADRSRLRYRRHRPVPGGPRYRRPKPGLATTRGPPLSGNLCRNTSYIAIFEVVLEARAAYREADNHDRDEPVYR